MSYLADKRNFCLMLSTPSGQDFAKNMGMTPPSEEVQEMERRLIDDQWELLHEFGIFDEISESVDWFTEVISSNMDMTDMPTPEALEGSKAVLISFGMALIQKLVENEMVILTLPVD
jgi:hypothetical protein